MYLVYRRILTNCDVIYISLMIEHDKHLFLCFFVLFCFLAIDAFLLIKCLLNALSIYLLDSLSYWRVVGVLYTFWI